MNTKATSRQDLRAHAQRRVHKGKYKAYKVCLHSRAGAEALPRKCTELLVAASVCLWFAYVSILRYTSV